MVDERKRVDPRPSSLRKNSAADWRVYAALINHPIFSEFLWELYDGTALQVVEDENGEYTLYGRKFTKIHRKMRMK